MPVKPTTGRFLFSLVAPQADCEVLEVGAGRAHSTIWLAAAARLLGGRVVSLERDPEVAADWRANVAEAGLEEWAELIEGDALETLAALDDVFDVVFIDAKKDEYERYFELARQLVDPGAPGRRGQRPLARGGPRRLQPGPPERPLAPERHRAARQRARGDLRPRALAADRLSLGRPAGMRIMALTTERGWSDFDFRQYGQWR